ncbi:transglutaminase-like domain-containing protein [Caldicoprobacter faecalis]|uniref:Transglutaminase-like superfamily protein n=1 Tax=Caldicoprobacter faecalis TaxID=937334 RepID=A0A1I5TAL4_9FIRM|nr:transglutaminase-like domain-containing protein [Caldicoprobacter faecalis]SFP80018.1 Transglutaminase-like superfamily protein [Caldicoprobacter faecalis]
MFTQKTIEKIEKDFKRVEPYVEKFKNIFDSADERERICLKYYYAYMPVSDLATYDASLFLKIIRHTLKVYDMNIFGVDIPEDIFLNYVLHYRVNNENIEYNREIFFNELYERIKGKSMYQAALEVNYWCLEKATYTPTNPRTVSPLTLIKNAKGRCGEESTFTVTALRSVGIPARQIYTPRWAHCDSNHAWVEVYIDGRWRFLGACEPEPALDRGWFKVPATRAMLIDTRVFSDIVYEDEEIIHRNGIFTELNLTSNYAKTKKLTIKVLNTGGRKVKVRFEVPNYCELSPIAVLETDENGIVSITTGLGDLHVHVTDGEKFMTCKVDVRKQEVVILDFANAVLKETSNTTIKLVPPVATVEDEDTIQDPVHEARIQHCNKVRAAFENTFITEEKGRELAKKYPGFHDDVARILVESKGNHEEIKAFLDSDNGIPFKYKVLLLKSIASKDLTDSTCEMLNDHLLYAYPFRDCFYEDIFVKYVLNPRIYLEMLSPYRGFINNFFDDNTKKEFVENPRKIYDYINEIIEDATEMDYRTLIASPQGTLQLKRASKISKKVLFVAICRSLGIPARFNPNDQELEYYQDGKFIRVVPYEPKEMVKLTLNCEEKLQYFRNFTIARLVNGWYQTLNFRGHDSTTFELEEGCYRILTGQRLDDGTMLFNAYFVELVKGNDLTLDVSIPKEEKIMEPVVISDYTFVTDEGNITLSDVLPKDYNIVAYVEPSKEPTEHLFRELMEEADIIKNKDIGIVLISANTNESVEKLISLFPELILIKTNDKDFAEMLLVQLGHKKGNYPVQALVQKTSEGILNALCYFSGYHVGSVSLMLKNA